MKKRQKQDIIDYVSYAKQSMGLRDWCLTLSFDIPKGSMAGGTCECAFGRKVATISFRKDIHKWEPDEIRSTIVHELLHCHFAPLVNAADNYNQLFPRKAAKVHELMFDQNMEYCVDAIATEWSENLEEFNWSK